MDGSHACFNFARSMVVRGVGGGQGGQLPTQVLEDQLTLSQPEGQIVPLTTLLLAHSALGSFLRP